MNVVRDRPAARLLPSRHHFALTRLIAYVALLAARCEEREAGLALAINRGQSAAEIYVAAVWIYATSVAYLAAALPWPWWTTIVPLAVVTPLLLQLPLFAIGWAMGDRDNVRLQSTALMSILLMASSYFATLPSPVRYAAWLFLGLVALNALAAALLFVLRRAVRAAEERCVA